MTPPHVPARVLRRRGWLWVGCWICAFVSTHIPVEPGGVLRLRNADKFVHAGMYFLLTWLGGRYVVAKRGEASARLLLAWAGAYLVYGVLDEWLQSYVGRSMSFNDWLADAVGVAAATIILLFQPGGGSVCPLDSDRVG